VTAAILLAAVAEHASHSRGRDDLAEDRAPSSWLQRVRRHLYLITRNLPSLILFVTLPLSEAGNPLRPEELPDRTSMSREQLMQQLSAAGKAADTRAAAAAPAAGLLGVIATLYNGGLSGRTELVIVAAATILAALFAQSARYEQMPGAAIDDHAIEIAAYALRRKEAWARLASYFAFGLAGALIALSIVS